MVISPKTKCPVDISPTEEKSCVEANQCDCLKPVRKLVPNCETAHSWSYRTMLVGRLVLRWPVQSLPIWLRHLSVWMPIKDFPVLGLDGPLRFDGSGSHSPEFVGYSGRRLPHCRTPERLCPQKVHLQSPCKEITQIVKKLSNSAFERTYSCWVECSILESGINILLRLLIFWLFSRGYGLIPDFIV